MKAQNGVNALRTWQEVGPHGGPCSTQHSRPSREPKGPQGLGHSGPAENQRVLAARPGQLGWASTENWSTLCKIKKGPSFLSKWITRCEEAVRIRPSGTYWASEKSAHWQHSVFTWRLWAWSRQRSISHRRPAGPAPPFPATVTQTSQRTLTTAVLKQGEWQTDASF